jgi:hypothetical protein
LSTWLDSCSGRPVLAEIEDPRLYEPTTEIDPWDRLRFYERLGARLLPLSYAQPPLRPGSPRVNGLLLIVMNHDGASLEGNLVARFLEEYYVECEGDSALEDPEFRRMWSIAMSGPSSQLALLAMVDLDGARVLPNAT